MNFESSKNAVNKLIILYVMKNMSMPLSKSQITNIVLENNLVNFFTLSQCLDEMEQSDLIKTIEGQQKSSYVPTENGSNTLEMFLSNIPSSIRTSIDKYISSNKETIKKEAQIAADFFKKSDKEYIVNLKVIENDIVLIDLKLSVVSSKQAKLICEKWKNSSEKIYSQIMSTFIN